MLQNARIWALSVIFVGQLLGQEGNPVPVADSLAYRWLERALDDKTPAMLSGLSGLVPKTQSSRDRMLSALLEKASVEDRIRLLPIVGDASHSPGTFVELIDQALEAEDAYEGALLDAAIAIAANLDDPSAWETLYYSELGPGNPIRCQAAAWAVSQSGSGPALETILRLACNDQRVDMMVPLLAETPPTSLGPTERQAIFDALANSYSNEHVRVQAVRALGRCGEDGLPLLIKAYVRICEDPGGAATRLASLVRRAMIRQTRVDYGADPAGWLRLLAEPQTTHAPEGVDQLPAPAEKTFVNVSLAGSGLLFALAGLSSIVNKRLGTSLAFVLGSLLMGIAAINGVLNGAGIGFPSATLSLSGASLLLIIVTIARITQFKPWLATESTTKKELSQPRGTLTQRLKRAAIRQALVGVKLLKNRAKSKKTLRSEVNENAFRTPEKDIEK